MTDFSSLWDDASADIEAEASLRALTSARVAVAGCWPFLAAAVDRADLSNRLSLASDSLHEAAAAGGVTVEALADTLVADWKAMQSTAAYYVTDGGKKVGGPYDDRAAAQQAIDGGDVEGDNLSVSSGDSDSDSGSDSDDSGGDDDVNGDGESDSDGDGNDSPDEDDEEDADKDGDENKNPFAKKDAAYNPFSDPQSDYNNPKKGPHNGTPTWEDGTSGIPLHGDLTDEQQAWMDKGKKKKGSLAVVASGPVAIQYPRDDDPDTPYTVECKHCGKVSEHWDEPAAWDAGTRHNMRHPNGEKGSGTHGPAKRASLTTTASHDPIGYTYDADVHCPDCAENAHGRSGRGFIGEDKHDGEGNPVGVIAPWDETSPHGEHCGTCGDRIAEPYDHNPKDCGSDTCSGVVKDGRVLQYPGPRHHHSSSLFPVVALQEGEDPLDEVIEDAPKGKGKAEKEVTHTTSFTSKLDRFAAVLRQHTEA